MRLDVSVPGDTSTGSTPDGLLSLSYHSSHPATRRSYSSAQYRLDWALICDRVCSAVATMFRSVTCQRYSSNRRRKLTPETVPLADPIETSVQLVADSYYRYIRTMRGRFRPDREHLRSDRDIETAARISHRRSILTNRPVRSRRSWHALVSLEARRTGSQSLPASGFRRTRRRREPPTAGGDCEVTSL